MPHACEPYGSRRSESERRDGAMWAEQCAGYEAPSSVRQRLRTEKRFVLTVWR